MENHYYYYRPPIVNKYKQIWITFEYIGMHQKRSSFNSIQIKVFSINEKVIHRRYLECDFPC